MKRVGSTLIGMLVATVVGTGCIVPRNLFETLKWCAYAPTNFDPEHGVYPSEASIREDLRVAKINQGCEGVIFYGSDNTLGQIPRIARELGYKGVIMGVWNPKSQEEIQNAIAAARYVNGYSVGNEGLTFPYSYGLAYTKDELLAAIKRLKDATRKAVTTTEPLFAYIQHPEYLDIGDWVFSNAHPYFANHTNPADAVAWTVEQYRALRKARPYRFVFFKETGLPTCGDARVNETKQSEFWRLLWETEVRFAFFELYDQPWKAAHGAVEGCWGTARNNRTPKQVLLDFANFKHIQITQMPAFGTDQNLKGRVLNVSPLEWMIVAYLTIGDGRPWIKPYVGRLTRIASDGSFEVDVTTGGIDEEAREYWVFLVKPDYQPQTNTLPGANDIYAEKRILRAIPVVPEPGCYEFDQEGVFGVRSEFADIARYISFSRDGYRYDSIRVLDGSFAKVWGDIGGTHCPTDGYVLSGRFENPSRATGLIIYTSDCEIESIRTFTAEHIPNPMACVVAGS